MRIAVGGDHRALEVKAFVLKLVSEAGHEAKDFGSYTTESVDYPDIAGVVGRAVAGGEFEQGILICNTGIGMSMAANKVKGIRAALCCDAFMAGRARQHNDANILCVGTELTPEVLADIVRTYLTAEFEGGRHLRRVNKIGALETG
jgi:ribose 5-phosphate isomerase B